ncbi:MAG: hypothetical protein N3C61_03295, partial [Candidatus Micrarchaeota archaeon]|nr:hypothetical protein [Candidatus Micrarchaeota archaeon]
MTLQQKISNQIETKLEHNNQKSPESNLETNHKHSFWKRISPYFKGLWYDLSDRFKKTVFTITAATTMLNFGLDINQNRSVAFGLNIPAVSIGLSNEADSYYSASFRPYFEYLFRKDKDKKSYVVAISKRDFFVIPGIEDEDGNYNTHIINLTMSDFNARNLNPMDLYWLHLPILLGAEIDGKTINRPIVDALSKDLKTEVMDTVR